jgi:hypothetical protein
MVPYLTICVQITLHLKHFRPTYKSFGCVISCILALFRPPESGSALGMRTWIQADDECGSGSETLVLSLVRLGTSTGVPVDHNKFR